MVVSDFRSLRGDIVFRPLLARQSPGGKNPVLRRAPDSAARWIDDLGTRNRYVLDVWAGG
jgi:hypothetical protein